MAKKQLSEKYRPAKFADLVGQESNVLILKELLKKQNFNTPFLFTGPFGSGKTSASRVFAKAVLCPHRTAEFEPCCVCQSCIDFMNDVNINYVEIDAATNGDAESIRNLRENIGYSSVNSAFKITNIDEAHNISKVGYNALLKQLEEGASHHIFMFCTNEPEKMLGTVRSRCWRIHSQQVTAPNLFTHMKRIVDIEKIQAEDAALDLISKITSPHIRDALNALDFLNYRGSVTKADVENYFQIANENLFFELLINVKADVSQMLQLLDKLVAHYDVDVIFEKLVEVCLALEARRKGAELQHGYMDESLVSIVMSTGCDFLAIASFLLKVEKPVDIHYLKYLLLELHRILNNESVSNYGVPPVIVYSDKAPINSAPQTAPENITKEEKKTIIPQEMVDSNSLSNEPPNIKAITPTLRTVNTTLVNARNSEEKEAVLTNKPQRILTPQEIRARLAESSVNEKKGT